MRYRSLLTGVASLIVVAGCDSSTGPHVEDINAHVKWLAKGPASYAYTVARYCFCLDEWIGPVEIVVRDGVVQSRTYVRTGAPVPASRYWDRFAVVDTLFARVADAQRGKPEKLAVTYDSQYGFPSRISVEAIGGMDDGYSFAATNFRVR